MSTQAGLRWVLGMAVLLAQAPLAAHEGKAKKKPAPWCWEVRGTIAVTFQAEGCDSPVGICTRGVFESAPGFLRGSTRFVATGIGGGAIGEESIVTPPSAEPGSTWSYSGVLTIHTALGDLVLSDAGVFDTANGLFSQLDRVRGGTGLYAAASGRLFMFGDTYPDGSGFAGDVRGRLCIPKVNDDDHEDDDDEDS